MAQVHVEHCSIRIVRHGGWSWGPEPRALLDHVISLLPRLLADAFGPIRGARTSREIVEPVRLRIALPLAAFRALFDANPSTDRMGANAAAPALEQIVSALQELLARYLPEVAHASAPAEPPVPVSPDTGEAKLAPGMRAEPLRALTAWFAQGRLAGRLEEFSDAALQAWHSHILASEGHASGSVPLAEIEGIVARFARHKSESADQATMLRLRLMVFAAVVFYAADALRNAEVRQCIERALPLDTPGAITSPRAHDPVSPPSRLEGPVQPPGGPRPQAASPQPVPGFRLLRKSGMEWQIETALPFLLLNPLSRLGWIDAAGATLRAGGLENAAPLFAAALAYKVMPPPARGWLRTQSAKTVSAFALLEEPPQDDKIAAFAREAAPHLSPLTALLSDTLIEGHRNGTPTLLTKVEAPIGRLMLSDVDGTFPIAIDDGVLRALPRLLHEIVLVDERAADPALLRVLDQAGVRFLTRAAPSRGENWNAVAGTRWWTNDPLTSPLRMRRAMQRFEPERAIACWHDIGVERHCVPRLRENGFDDALTFAAATALGTIAWELWRERETTAPSLALARFHDFDARVRIDAESVRVLLPLGRRFFDLSEHGLLGDVPDVPWLGGRILQFSSG